MTNPIALVGKLWNYCSILRDTVCSMAMNWRCKTATSWGELSKCSDMLGIIFRKAPQTSLALKSGDHEYLPSSADESSPILHRMRQRFSSKVQERIERIPKNGGSRRHHGPSDQLECHKRQAGFNDVYGRLSWDKVSVTITRSCHNPSKGRYLHPEENRALTLYEAMLLQGFPSSYKLSTDGGIEKTASPIGEAFPPPFALAQAAHILPRITKFQNGEVFCKAVLAGTLLRCDHH